MSYTGEEIALVAKGARWCEWERDGDGWSGGALGDLQQWVYDDGLLSDQTVSALLFVALLDKCVDSGMQPGIYRRGKVWRAHAECASNHWADHKNRTIALLLALDAAGLLPKEDA